MNEKLMAPNDRAQTIRFRGADSLLERPNEPGATATRGTVNGFEMLILENSRIRVSVIPSLGGRVWELVDKARDRQWIWHREGVPLSATPPGSCYDDLWAGGWEELFPNDAPADFEGRALPDHGEWWTTAWKVADVSSGSEAVVRLVAETAVRRCSCTKEFRLAAESNTISISYRIENLESEPFHFLFKQHLPVAVTQSCTLVVPGGTVTAVDPTFGSLLPDPGPFSWPGADGSHSGFDLRTVPPRSSREREFVYIRDVVDGWCGVDDTAAGASLRLRFDRTVMPYLWLFLAYGGWRSCYTAVLEPCTNMPKDLAEATRAGQSAYLDAGGVFETSVTATLTGLRRAY